MKVMYFLAFFLYTTSIYAQQVECGTTESQSSLEEKELEEMNDIIYKYFSQNRNITTKNDSIIILPIVVHIIHQNEEENISEDQILRGIQHLNDAFANRNSYNRGKGFDTKIRFCLAHTDPNGNYTLGITRTSSPLTSIRFMRDDKNLKDLIRWDTRNYINIWLVKEIRTLPCERSVTGYAKFPSSHGGNLDGIVCQARDFGSNPSNSVVQIHEMGHYLGLLHTFEGLDCKNYICLRDGDKVCDTPPDRLDFRSGRDCDDPPNSCSTDKNDGFDRNVRDMISNYMDYEDTACQHDFTEGQAERMHYNIERFRASLLTSPACTSPCSTSISALFESSQERIVFKIQVQFRALENNAAIYEWRLNGEVVSNDRILNYQFPEIGIYDVELTVKNSQFGDACMTSHKERIRTFCVAEAAFEVETINIIPEDSLYFSNSSTNALSFEWLIGSDLKSTAQDFEQIFSRVGEYKITLKVTNDDCIDTESVSVQVGTIQPDLEISLLEETATCSRDSVTFSFKVCNNGLASIPADVPISFYSKDPSIVFSKPLEYFITPVAIDYNCCEVFTHIVAAPLNGRLYVTVNDDFSKPPFSYAEKTHDYRYYELDLSNNRDQFSTIEINPLDYAYFDTTACYNGDSVFLKSVEPDAYYLWDTGDSTNFTTIATIDKHWVDITYCGITRRHHYDVSRRNCSCQFDLPNVFTPNEDGLNDSFGFYYDCEYQIDTYTMQIFNRWGKLIFETNDPDEDWAAESMPSDLYVYIIYFEESYEEKKEVHQLKGKVTLLR